jgi:DNA-binding MarR family transcriptional regulator
VADQIGIPSLDERIPFLLSQLGARLAEDFQRRLAPLGIDPRAYAVLMALSENDGQSQRRLSERLGIHRNVMVGLIDAMQSQGLVERRAHPQDRRAFAVTLTGKARELLPALHRQALALEDEIASPLSASERDVLRRQLQRLAAAAGLIPGVHPRLG